jgi:hypothetical protein
VLVAMLSQGLGGAPAVLAAGLQPLDVPFSGGALLVQPLALLPATLDGPAGVPGAGAASFALPIPAPSGAGTTVYLQGFVLDSGAGTLGALTGGLAAALGGR